MAGNSLGTLTLDLVARIGGFVEPIRQAENQTDQSFGNMGEHAKQFGVAVGAAMLASAAAIGAMTVETIHNANEIARLSVIAGTSTKEFQRMTAGAKAFGFEQDALADILKDVQEKFGEYSSIGGGGALDFFEQIAPKVGVTADMFEKLSGAQALQLYVDSMEKAGVGTKEMIYYMESLASESSKLLPLLKNGGEVATLFGDAAERAGVILDEKTIAKSNELKGALYLLDLQVSGIKNNIASELIPTLLDLSEAFSAQSEDDKMIDWTKHLDNALRGVGATVLSLIGTMHTLGKLALVVPSSLGPAFTKTEKPLEKIWQNMKDGFKDAVDTNNEYGKRVDDLLLGNQVSDETRKIGEALGASELAQQAEASREAGALMLADKQAALNAYIRLNASELENVRFKYADMRKEITANTKFSVDEKAKATAAVNQAEAKELADVKKRLSDEAKAKADAAQLVKEQKAQDLKTYALMNATELDQIKATYAAEREALTKKTGWSANERKRALTAINDAEKQAIDDYNNKIASSLDVYADMNKTELELVRDKYNDMRKEVDKNIEYTKEQREQAYENIRKAENKEVNDSKMAIRTKYDDLLRIEMDYQAELKRIRESDLDDETKKKYVSVATNTYNKTMDQQLKPFSDLTGRLNGDLGDDNFDNLKEKYELEKELILQYTLDNEMARQELLTKLQDEYHNAQMMTTMAYGSDIAGSMAEIMSQMGDDQSKAYKVMFALSKAFAIADSIMKIQQGIAAAAANPFPYNIAAMASVAAATAGLVGNIRSVRMVGQAHDGIMSVPDSGTWNLQKGERVLPQDTAQRLDNTLERIDAGGSASGINVNIENYGSSKQFDVQQIDAQTVRIIARDEVARGAGRAVAADLSNPNSDVSKGMQRNLQVERRR